MVKIWVVPDLLPLKMDPWAFSVSSKMSSDDKLSNGFCDGLFFYIIQLNQNLGILWHYHHEWNEFEYQWNWV